MNEFLVFVLLVFGLGVGIAFEKEGSISYSKIEKVAQMCELESVSYKQFVCKNGLIGEWPE